MKRLVSAAVCAVAFVASVSSAAASEHLDIIENKFVNGCSYSKFKPVVDDFNKWAADYGYNARIALPIQSRSSDSFFWIGTSKDAATFGTASDAWIAALGDDKSVPSKLADRFGDCVENVSRSGYYYF